MAVRKLIPSISISLVEVILLQSKNDSIHPRHRGAPLTKKFGTPALLGKAVNDISHEDFQSVLSRYVADRPNRRSGWRFVEELNALMRWAVRAGCRTAPWVPYTYPKKEAVEGDLLEPADVEQVLQAVDTLYPNDLRVQIAIRALVLLGLGVQESTEFSFDRVDFPRHEYHQTDQRARYRIIPISPAMQALISKAWQQKVEASGRGAQPDLWITGWELSAVVQRLRDYCGFERLMPSTLVRTALGGK